MQEAKRQYHRVEERHYSAHHTLLHIAELSLGKAEAREPGWFNEAFICITFSALAVEALANAIGKRVIQDWANFEPLPPKEKIKQLKRTLQVPINEAPKVWHHVAWLNAFRNRIAHPKPEFVKLESLLDTPAEPNPFEAPESELERMISIKRANESFNAVYQAKHILCSHVPAHLNEGLEVDIWGSSTELLLHGLPHVES